MRQAAVAEPESLVVTGALNGQRIAVPLAGGIAVVRGYAVILGGQRAAIQIDQAPVAIGAAGEKEDALPVRLLDDLESVGHHELPRTARRQAARHGIVLQQV